MIVIVGSGAGIDDRMKNRVHAVIELAQEALENEKLDQANNWIIMAKAIHEQHPETEDIAVSTYLAEAELSIQLEDVAREFEAYEKVIEYAKRYGSMTQILDIYKIVLSAAASHKKYNVILNISKEYIELTKDDADLQLKILGPLYHNIFMALLSLKNYPDAIEYLRKSIDASIHTMRPNVLIKLMIMDAAMIYTIPNGIGTELSYGILGTAIHNANYYDCDDDFVTGITVAIKLGMDMNTLKNVEPYAFLKNKKG